MIDKELFKLIGENKKYIFTAVLTQVIGLWQTSLSREASAMPFTF